MIALNYEINELSIMLTEPFDHLFCNLFCKLVVTCHEVVTQGHCLELFVCNVGGHLLEKVSSYFVPNGDIVLGHQNEEGAPHCLNGVAEGDRVADQH
jgi:hypothetical protein